METMEKKETTFSLPNKRLEIVPIKRKGAWLPDYHEASFLFGEAKFTFVVKRDSRTKRYKDPLTAEEREFFENSRLSNMPFSSGDLNINNPKEKNWWLKQRYSLGKDKMILDLSNPNDYLMYKLLLTNDDLVAPSASKKFAKGTYKYALVDIEEVEKSQADESYSKLEAFEKVAAMKDSAVKLKDFLRAYWWDQPSKNVAPNSRLEWLVKTVTDIANNDTRGFLKLMGDADYEYRVMAEKALLAKALDRRKSNYYIPEDPNPIANNMLELIEYFKNKKNQENVLTIQARIDNAAI